MGYKEMDKTIIDWSRVETILMSHYTIGISNEGADVYPIEFEDHSMRAYPPLLLFKCFLLQKWFHPREIGSHFTGQTSILILSWKTKFTQLVV